MVGTATFYMLESQNHGGGETLFTHLDWLQSPPSLPYNGYQGSSSVVKQLGHGIDHPLPSSAEVKKNRHTPTPSPCLRSILQRRLSPVPFPQQRPAIYVFEVGIWTKIMKCKSRSQKTQNRHVFCKENLWCITSRYYKQCPSLALVDFHCIWII
jgi:hypothetical protein